MDECVEHSEEGAVTSGCKFDPPPNRGWHHTVVNHMEIGDLIEFLTQDKENRIHELGEFAEIIPPTQLGNNQLIRIVRVINRLASKTVAMQPRMDQTLIDKVDAEDDLDDVVNDDCRTEFKRLAISHQSRAQRFDKVDVTDADE